MFSILDALEQFDGRTESLYYIYDGHLTEAGNALVAGEIFDYLLAAGILPGG